jgi:hypothetical protein
LPEAIFGTFITKSEYYYNEGRTMLMKYKEAYSGNNEECRDFLIELFHEFVNGKLLAQDKMKIVPTDEDIEYKVKYGRDEFRIKLYSNDKSKEKEEYEEDIKDIKDIKEEKINIKEKIKEEIKEELKIEIIKELKEEPKEELKEEPDEVVEEIIEEKVVEAEK